MSVFFFVFFLWFNGVEPFLRRSRLTDTNDVFIRRSLQRPNM